MRYGSVCSGIEAASVAWQPLGWKAAWFSEIDKFPSAVLAHRFPDVPNLGDMTKYKDWPDDPIDLLVGGTPCQSFSIAGLRKGLADPRGNLMLTYLAIAKRYRPRWIVWENVSGVRSSHHGRDFGTFLGALGELGYGWAYRSLDAQYAGLAQRRERVFVVGCLGDWRRAAEVLFEPASLSWDTPACVAQRQGAARRTSRAPRRGRLWRQIAEAFGAGETVDGGLIAPVTANPLTANMAKGVNTTMDEGKTMIAHSLRGEDGTGHGIPLAARSLLGKDNSSHQADKETYIPVAIQERAVSENLSNGPQGKGYQENIAYTLEARNKVQAVAFDMRGRDGGAMPEGPHDTANIRAANGGSSRSYVASPMAVRRLTPRECERLQGFPDDWTLISGQARKRLEDDMLEYLRASYPDLSRAEAERLAKDGPRYKAIGNSMAVPVMRWIGERIDLFEREVRPMLEAPE